MRQVGVLFGDGPIGIKLGDNPLKASGVCRVYVTEVKAGKGGSFYDKNENMVQCGVTSRRLTARLPTAVRETAWEGEASF